MLILTGEKKWKSKIGTLWKDDAKGNDEDDDEGEKTSVLHRIEYKREEKWAKMRHNFFNGLQIYMYAVCAVYCCLIFYSVELFTRFHPFSLLGICLYACNEMSGENVLGKTYAIIKKSIKASR